uniref:Uncharacterized protein n=1 Tax=Dulem virus 42 TaxID=3145760 RepID=A0AAU8B850_9CAUD
MSNLTITRICIYIIKSSKISPTVNRLTICF